MVSVQKSAASEFLLADIGDTKDREETATVSLSTTRPLQLDTDGGLRCFHQDLADDSVFQDSKLPLHALSQRTFNVVIEHLSKAFGTWSCVTLRGKPGNPFHHILELYHPEALIAVILDQAGEQHSVDRIYEIYQTKRSLHEILGTVKDDHPKHTFLFHINMKDLQASVASEYIRETLLRSTNRDIVLLEGESPDLVAIHGIVCKLQPSWKVYSNGQWVLLKSKDLIHPAPVHLPAPPSITSQKALPKCDEEKKPDIIMMTKNRPLQLLAFLESLSKTVKSVNTIWIVQQTTEDVFRDAYKKVVLCMSKHFHLEVLEQGDSILGPIVLKALEKSTAEYAMFAVDEIVWTNTVDLAEVTCLLENSGSPFTSFQLRLGENLKISLSQEQKSHQFVTVESNARVLMYYPLHLSYDYAYLMHVDAMVVKRQVMIDDLGRNLPRLQTPGMIETSWLNAVLYQRCRQWHFMYKQSSFVNNMGHIDGRVANAAAVSKGSYELLDLLIKEEKKIDVDAFIRENKQSVRMTHMRLPVQYKKWLC